MRKGFAKSLFIIIPIALIIVLGIILLIIKSATGFNLDPLSVIVKSIDKYPNSSIWEVTYTKGAKNNPSVSFPTNYVISYSTDDDQANVLSFYDAKLKKEGWHRQDLEFTTDYVKGLVYIRFFTTCKNSPRFQNTKEQCQVITIDDYRWIDL